MRIQDKQRTKNTVSSGQNITNHRLSTDENKKFTDVMRERQYEWDGNLNELLERLDELGKNLVESFSIYDLRAYKDTLKNFLNETYGKAYHLKEDTVWTKRGKNKVYQTIEKINGELEELSNLVLSYQKDLMKILKKLDQIRGLMVDLYS